MGRKPSATGVGGTQTNNGAAAAGAAYVFTRSGATWSQQAYLKASNTGAADNFGISVGISGDTAVIGAFGEASASTGVNGSGASNATAWSGAAYVFIRSGAVWSQQAYLKAASTAVNAFFGYAVAIDGDSVVVGAYGEASNTGGAYVFSRSGATWSQQKYLQAANAEGSDQFGMAVAIGGGTVVVGAVGESSAATGIGGDSGSNGATESGAGYVFPL